MTSGSPSRQINDEVLERPKPKATTPKLYGVALINDDYTTMEFVVTVIEKIFQKSPAEAFQLMMQVHTAGQAICGIYTYEIAETKVHSVTELAEAEGFPLQATIEDDPHVPE